VCFGVIRARGLAVAPASRAGGKRARVNYFLQVARGRARLGQLLPLAHRIDSLGTIHSARRHPELRAEHRAIRQFALHYRDGRRCDLRAFKVQ
jgi:hypothetical protein